MKLRRYCVTVMDNWSSTRRFWTRDAALAYRDKIGEHAHAYRWSGNLSLWVEMYAIKWSIPQDPTNFNPSSLR